jgi:hypothetical protein
MYDQKKWVSLKLEKAFEPLNPYCPEYDTFAKTILDPVIRREFDTIGTKTMYRYKNGYVPSNCNLYEK